MFYLQEVASFKTTFIFTPSNYRPMRTSIYFFLVSLFCGVLTVNSPELSAQDNVTVTIDAGSSIRPVSPWIYGRNNSLSKNPSSPTTAATWQRLRDAGVTMLREGGGNNSTKYNWRRKLSSHPDWYNNVYAQDWDFSARSLAQNLPGVQGLWTLSLIGYTAMTNVANFNDWSYNQSKWWEGVNQNLAGGGTVNPAGGNKALKDGNPELYLESWPADSVVGILRKWFGENGLGLNNQQFLYWNMDNEPEIWNGTHDDVMPEQISAEEFMQRYFETAKKARALFPGIKLAGPVPANEWQWYNWKSDRILYKGKYHVWLEYFIRRVAEEQAASGIRLLDVLDIHFYPSESKAADIVQSHRVYFDRNYVYPGANGVKRAGSSGWDNTINKEYIFGRCQDWLNTYMGTNHGVTFGVTETAVNTNDPNVIAVWYASMLGEFAKQGVEIFTPWDWKVGMWEVLHLFTRFNHDFYTSGVSGQEEFVSAYPTMNATGDSLTVILVNRSTDKVKKAMVNLLQYEVSGDSAAWFRINSLGSTETFLSKTQNALKKGKTALSSGGFSTDLPPLSVTSVVITGKRKTTGLNIPAVNPDTELRVWPNPASGAIRISCPSCLVSGASVAAYNMQGKLMEYHVLSEYQLSGNEFAMDVAGWKPGLYMLTVSSSGTQKTVKLMVTHSER